jgi:Acetyltransferase (GNAT) domain
VNAELIEDRGEAASSGEFFRSREFNAAEGVTHSLRLAGDEGTAVLPVLVRAIPGADLVDAVSPYGYPGAEIEGDPPAPADVDFSATGLVSVFVRDRLDRRSLADGSERSTVQVADPELPRKSRMSDRQQVRRNERAGYGVRSVKGPESSEGDRDAFRAVYEQTMRRTDASERYFFSASYFDSVLSSERTWLFLVDSPGADAVAAASIAALSDGFLHYYLSGTSDDHLSEAPMKNLLEAMISFAEELGAPLNLGGGLTPGDGLEEFKRGFANRQEAFVTHEVVCDSEAYARLSDGKGESGFFPAYRAG